MDSVHKSQSRTNLQFDLLPVHNLMKLRVRMSVSTAEASDPVGRFESEGKNSFSEFLEGFVGSKLFRRNESRRWRDGFDLRWIDAPRSSV